MVEVDDDTELKDLVSQALEGNGLLSNIRAQLRAGVFQALEQEKGMKNKSTFVNDNLRKFTSSSEGRMVTSLVREFLEWFQLDFTLSVWDPESQCGGEWNYPGRDGIAQHFNVNSNDTGPLLAHIINRDITKSHQNVSKNNQSKDKSSALSHHKKLEEVSPLHKEDKYREELHRDTFIINTEDKHSKYRQPDSNVTQRSGGSSLTSLSSLPPLDLGGDQRLTAAATDQRLTAAATDQRSTTAASEQSPKPTQEESHSETDTAKQLERIDKRIQELGFEIPTSVEEGDEVSEAQQRGKVMIDDSITEIDEDLDADDLLNSSVSALDDLTGVETVSGESGKSNDYMETL